MINEKQVTSLELSKRLEKLGFKQESIYYWEKCPSEDNDTVLSNDEWHDMWTGEWGDAHELKDQEIYSAFTVGELGEIMHRYAKSYRRLEGFSCIFSGTADVPGFSIMGDTEAEVRGLMCEELRKKKLI